MSITVVQELKFSLNFSLKFFQYFYIERVFDARKVWATLNYKILMKVDVIYKSLYSIVKMLKMSHLHQYYEKQIAIVGFCHIQNS